jgi:capsular polysaccharide biosynthesis protein
MKFYLGLLSLLIFVSLGMAVAQDASEANQDTATEERADDSSAFQDSIKYDDMDPIFYEAEEEEAAPAAPEKSMNMGLIIGIVALVVIVVFILIRRSSKKPEA